MGLSLKAIANQLDGTLRIVDIEHAIRSDDIHCATTALVTIENTHIDCGGRILSPEYTASVVNLCKKYNLKSHLDGARLFNAAVKLGIEPRQLTEGIDSVTLCLSKGLAAPVGAVLAGTCDFIRSARRIRKVCNLL